MTERPPDLEPDAIDELLSADIDGEVAGAAHDLGLDENEVRVLLAEPAAIARRAALVGARAALEVEPLSEHERARLLRTARDAYSPSRSERASRDRRAPWGLVASVAAALVLVAGLASVVTTMRDDSDTAADTRSAAGAASTTVAAAADALAANGVTVQPVTGDLGDDAVLRGLLTSVALEKSTATRSAEAGGSDGGGSDNAAQSPGTPETDTFTGSTTVTDSTSSTVPAPAVPYSSDLARPLADAEASCLDSFTGDYEAAPDAVYSGEADGRPAIVVVFTKGSNTSAVVYAADTCRQLRFVSRS